MQITRRTLAAAMLGTAAASAGARFARADTPRTIALMFDAFDSEFWIVGNQILHAKAQQNGWTVLQTVSDRDQNKQNDQVKSMCERKVDAILFIPTDKNACIPAIRTANHAHVPIVLFNRPPAPNHNIYTAIQADNRKIMQQTVQVLVDKARKLGGRYKACIMIGDLGDQNAVQRRDGFFDVADKNKDIIDVVARVATEWNADKAFAGLTNVIQANPDINFLVTSSDFLHPQIEQVLKSANKWHKIGEPGHVLFGGFDGDEGAYARLQDGYLDACGVQNLFLEVDMAFGAFEDLWAGKKPDKLLLDPGFVITQDTLMAKRDEMWGYTVWKKMQKG